MQLRCCFTEMQVPRRKGPKRPIRRIAHLNTCTFWAKAFFYDFAGCLLCGSLEGANATGRYGRVEMRRAGLLALEKNRAVFEVNGCLHRIRQVSHAFAILNSTFRSSYSDTLETK